MFNRTKRIDGMKFGMLTAIAPSHMVGSQVYYHFRCDCGESRVFRKCNVVTGSAGNTRSCGCAVGREDFTGRKFNRLSVLSKVPAKAGRRGMIYECECECGTKLNVAAKSLKKGQVSCGCFVGEYHGESYPPTAEYIAWRSMIGRCYLKGGIGYENYGGRGIGVCDEWRRSYLAFLGHAGRRPSEKHSLGRINNDGNYEPGNVRWETDEQQLNNKRTNAFVEFGGRRLTHRQWDRELGLPSGMTGCRINRGWSAERAMTTPCTLGKHTKP